MFGLLRSSTRAFIIGAVVGVLFAPRPGAQTRRMLKECLTAAVNQFREMAAVSPVRPERARTNGHSERAGAKRTRQARTDAHTP